MISRLSKKPCGIIRGTVGVLRKDSSTTAPPFDPAALNLYQDFRPWESMLVSGGGEAGIDDELANLPNSATGSNAASDATQTVQVDRPHAFPVEADGYLYQPGAYGNAPSVTFPAIATNEDFTLTMEVHLLNTTNFNLVTGATSTSRIFVLNNKFYVFSTNVPLDTDLTAGNCVLEVQRVAGVITLKQDGVTKATLTRTTAQQYEFVSFNGQFSTSSIPFEGAIYSVTLSVSGVEELAIDFTNPADAHGANAITATTGQTVTINTSGNNPASIMRTPSFRGDGVASWLQGTFAAPLSGCRAFMAFKVLGDGGDANGFVLSLPPASSTGTNTNGAIALLNQSGGSRAFYEGTSRLVRASGFTGTHIHEVLLSGSAHKYLLDGAAEITNANALSIASTRFSIMAGITGSATVAIEVYYIGLAPADITEDQATQFRAWISEQTGIPLA